MSLKPWDIVLVGFPFTNLQTTKVRPAIIVSSELVHQQEDDFTLMFISSVLPTKWPKYDLLLAKKHPEFKLSGLKKDSLIKTNKVVTLQKDKIIRSLGSIGPKLQKAIIEAAGYAWVIL